ncbi:c-Myc-binding protein isoform X2 [Venturia canescens]|uniref:c-Myc-binding protein isoform X2 n=1 Tax=Venturia canescens TaxID=32260 RepID=UPI001C9D0AF7|nr:c-Myc-binding protein-like isoform X2 [Venturia canescens]
MSRDVEAKREEFRKYLERAGVIDALTKVLVLLYEETEKPDDALDYVRKYLSNATDSKSEVETLKQELESAKDQIAELEAKLQKCDLDVTPA